MAVTIKGYFYNALLNEGVYDRLYNDEDFCHYLKELVGNGVFPTPSTQMAVTNTTGMGISIAAGEAWLEGRKVSNESDVAMTLDSADPIFPRIDRVVVRTDSTESVRAGVLDILKGEAKNNPEAPELTRNDDIYELCLAEIRIAPGATSISSIDITDTRPNSELCGWVAGLIQQIDISTLYEQYRLAYASLYSAMSNWQEEMRAQFDAWYYMMSSQLTVGAYIRSFHKVVRGGDTVSNVIPLDMEGYEYDLNDIFIANLNGLSLTKDEDYTLGVVGNAATINLDGNLTSGNLFEITVLKSSMSQTSGGYLTRAKGEKFVYVFSAMPGQAQGFIVKNTGDDNEIVVTNRNLIDYTQIPSDVEINGLFFYNNGEDGVRVNGTSTGAAFVEIPLDVEALNYIPYCAVLSLFDKGETTETTGVSLILSLVYDDDTTEDIVCTKDPMQFYPDSTNPVKSATIKIGVGNPGVNIQNKDIFPMISNSEEGGQDVEFVPGTRSTFNFDGGITKPIFTDNINYIYSTDPDVSDMMVIYTVLDTLSDGDDIQY